MALAFAFALASALALAPADSAPTAPTPPALRVVAAGSAPFVAKTDGVAHGMSIAVWQAVASRAQLTYDLEVADSIDEALDGVASGRYDVAVGPISITYARARRVAFTQPYFQSTLSIVTTEANTSTWARVRPFFTRAVLVGVLALLAVLGLVGVLLWLTERRVNREQFPDRPVPGIGAGLWLALVTMTTVGYGDKAPQSGAGRFVAGLWMLVAMVTASSLTASFATALTLSQIGADAVATPDELRGQRVAVVQGAPAARFVRELGAQVVTVPHVDEGLEQLAADNVWAFVHDRVVLVDRMSSRVQRGDDDGLILTPAEYEPRGYGFAVAHGNPLLRPIDEAVLQLGESGVIDELR